MASNKTIVLKGYGHHEEGVLGTIAAPGEAIELQGDGEYDRLVSVVATALKGGLKIVKEDALQGKTVDDAYAIGDTVFLYSPIQGDHVQVLVKTGEDIDIGDNIVVEGGTSGLFVEAAGTETKFQLEALEDSGGVLAANTLIKCRVL
jgi:hypothetical protein